MWFICLLSLLQMVVSLHVIPWCTNRGRQCFWRPEWRPLCTLLLHCMLTPVLLHWRLTLSPYQATGLLLSMGKAVLLKKTHSIQQCGVKRLFDFGWSYRVKADGVHSIFPENVLLNNYRCLIDSVLPESSSRFFPRKQASRLCFIVQAFRLDQESEGQVPIHYLKKWQVFIIFFEQQHHTHHFNLKCATCWRPKTLMTQLQWRVEHSLFNCVTVLLCEHCS